MTPGSADRLLVSAGEASGDLFAAEVAVELLRRQPTLALEGCGGPAMARAGVEIRWDASDLGAMGLGGALRSLPRHWRIYRSITGAAPGRYRAAVLVDYPGFHLRLGRALRARGVPVVQLVAPQLWAWRPGRLSQLSRAADAVGAVLPFEPEWFAQRGLAVTYLGHPVVDRPPPDGPTVRTGLGLPAEGPVLGIFPGSRPAEIAAHWPLMRAVGVQLLAEGACAAVLVAAREGGRYPDPGPIQLVPDGAPTVLAAATAALVKSGTTTLEAACAGLPHVVVYQAPRLSYELARRLLTVRWIALTNLVAGEAVVPEFWRLPIHAETVASRLRPLLQGDGEAARAQREAFARIRARLGPPGAANRAAELVAGVAGC